MAEKINVGVIGCGYMGNLHSRMYAEMSEVDLRMVCDSDLSKAKFLASKLNNTNYINDYRKVLNNPDIDAVSICTPTKSHFEIAYQALKNGKNVLIEKPLASSMKEAKNLIRLRDKYDTVAMVGHVERYNPITQKLFDNFGNWLEKKNIRNLFSRRVGPKPDRLRETGVLYQLAVHDIDIILAMLGMPNKIHCSLSFNGNSIENHSVMLLQYPNLNAVIESSWLYSNKQRYLEIFSDNSYVKVDYLNLKILYENASKQESFAIDRVEPLKNELMHFISCIKNEGEPLTPLEDGLNIIKILEKILNKYHRKEN